MPLYSATAKNGQKFYARQLTKDDAPALKRLRLVSLLDYGPMFHNYVKHELAQPDSYWRELAEGSETQSFHGLFTEKGRLVGIQAARKHDDDLTGKTALWYSAFVLPEARGIGAAKPLYKSRKAWCIDHGFTNAVFFILDRCKRSTAIHKKQGAQFTDRRLMSFYGGPKVAWNWFEVSLIGAAIRPENKKASKATAACAAA